MQFSTTPTLEGQSIVRCCDVVTGGAILGANIFRDFLVDIRDIVGDHPGMHKKGLRKACGIAFRKLGEQVRALSADVMADIDIDYETISKDDNMLIVSVSGTAAKIRR